MPLEFILIQSFLSFELWFEENFVALSTHIETYEENQDDFPPGRRA